MRGYLFLFFSTVLAVTFFVMKDTIYIVIGLILLLEGVAVCLLENLSWKKNRQKWIQEDEYKNNPR